MSARFHPYLCGRNAAEWLIDMRYVRGHVEVFDWRGEFCFSADSMAEAMEELREQSSA